MNDTAASTGTTIPRMPTPDSFVTRDEFSNLVKQVNTIENSLNRALQSPQVLVGEPKWYQRPVAKYIGLGLVFCGFGALGFLRGRARGKKAATIDVPSSGMAEMPGLRVVGT